MRNPVLRALACATAALCLLVPVSHALAQAAPSPGGFPARPIHLIVAFAPGGATDILARAVAQQFAARTGANVIVENKPGGSGAVAMEFVVRAAPDGYTLLWGSDSVVVQPLLHKDFPVDPMKDLVPLTRLGLAPNVLSVGKNVPVRNLKELIALAKAKPGSLHYGSGGNGSIQQFAGEELKQRAGIDVVHIPYKGTGPAITDMLSGNIEMVFSGAGEIAAYVASGDARPIAITSEARIAALPNVPTMVESGLPGFVSGSWMGVLAPAAVPKPILNYLSENIIAAGETPEFRQRAATFGMGVNPLNSADTETFMKALSARAQEAIVKSHISID